VIIGHLINDTHSLLACSLTCYSWYIATVPHLHHTLTTSAWYSFTNSKFVWPKPLRGAHKLGLLPLVRKFQIHRRDLQFSSGFSPKRFNCCSLRHFRALTNVQDLGIDCLDIPSFMPHIQLYLGHFLPTLRSLAMGEPNGSRRQIIYFIGLFRHLEDLKILYDKVNRQEEPEDHATLIPPFVPPLRGRLTMCSTGVGLLKDMIDLFGGARFRYLDIFNVGGTRLLLDACAGTLETLRLYPSDPRGKERSLGNVRALANCSAGSNLLDFNLSQSKSLRTLEFRVRHLDSGLRNGSLYAAGSLLYYVLSTISSPLFSKVVAVYQDYDFCGIAPPELNTPLLWMTGEEVTREARQHAKRFGVFRSMHRERDFQLVLCVDVWEGTGDYALGLLEEAVAVEKKRVGFNRVSPEPLVVFRPRNSRQDPVEYMIGALNIPNPWLPL